MVLIFLSVLPVIFIQPILHSALPEIKFQTIKTKHLHPEEANLDAKILMQLLLHPHLCLPELQ